LWPIFIIPYTIFVIRIIALAVKAKLPFKQHWAIGIWSKAFKKGETKHGNKIGTEIQFKK